MKVEKKEIQLIKKEVIISSKNLCDKCNKDISEDIEDNYDAFDFKIIYNEGVNYPDFQNINIKEIELCKKCAVECIDLLKSNGYRINESNYNN